jgi:transcriptional regulator with XRE-family HTH domain
VYNSPMDPSWEPQPEGRRLAEALQRKIRESGLGYSEVERRLGMGKDTLRHILSGRVELKVKHVYGVLMALGIAPPEFFAEFYGLLTPLQAANQNLHPQFVPSLFRVQSAAVWFIARKLKEKGILTDAEVEAFVAEFERKGPTL